MSRANAILYFVLYTVAYCTGQISVEPTDDGFRDVQDLEHERELVLWQELKRDVQTLTKSRDTDAKLLARLQAENSNLKSALNKLETRQKADAQWCRTAATNADWSKSNEHLLTRMSRELENLAGNLNCSKTTTNRLRRDDKDDHLYADVENLKQEISAIKLLEDEQFPAVATNLTEQGKTLDRLLAETEALGDKLVAMETSPVEQFVPYDGHTEFEKMNLRIAQLGAFFNGLQDQVYKLSDKYKWYSFLVEQFNTELHVVKSELYKMMKVFYKIDDDTQLPDDDVPSSGGWPDENESDGDNHIVYDGSNLNGEEGSGTGPKNIFVQKGRNLRTEMDRVAATASDAYAQVHQLMTRMNALETQQSVLEKNFANKPSAPSFDNNVVNNRDDSSRYYGDDDQCSVKLTQFKRELGNVTTQLVVMKTKLVDVNTMFTTDVTDLRKQLNVCSLKCDRAKHVADIVREHQVDHFTAIQEMRHELNVFESSLNTATLKLATFQTDLLNATLTTYKDINKELQQDLHLNKLNSDMDKLSKKFNENQESLKSVFTSLKQKADRSDFKRISDDVDKTNEKLQLVVSLGENVATLMENVDKLESQLPHDCSMQTVPAKAGVYRSGVYLIKPWGFIRSVEVDCDMDSDGGYWTVIHRRFDGHVTFNRTWLEYEYGFGDPNSDHWLGNGVLHALTSSSSLPADQNYELRIDAWDIFGDYYYALYNSFRVTSPDYVLRVTPGGFDGNMSDALAYHNGMRFSAVDKDLDASSTHCAKNYESGWWFSHCHKANLNGDFARGMIWFNNRTQDWLQFKKSSMKIRPKKRLFA